MEELAYPNNVRADSGRLFLGPGGDDYPAPALPPHSITQGLYHIMGRSVNPNPKTTRVNKAVLLTFWA